MLCGDLAKARQIHLWWRGVSAEVLEVGGPPLFDIFAEDDACRVLVAAIKSLHARGKGKGHSSDAAQHPHPEQLSAVPKPVPPLFPVFSARRCTARTSGRAWVPGQVCKLELGGDAPAVVGRQSLCQRLRNLRRHLWFCGKVCFKQGDSGRWRSRSKDYLLGCPLRPRACRTRRVTSHVTHNANACDCVSRPCSEPVLVQSVSNLLLRIHKNKAQIYDETVL